ncbi:MAG: hypothetical protein AAGE18_17065 [Pseudomonadota bacterium]
MSNSFALGLGTLIVGLLVADYIWQDFAGVIFLGKRLIDLSEWLAFWR